MSKYLTPEGFCTAFFERFDYAVFKDHNSKATKCDIILALIFNNETYHKEISEHLKSTIEYCESLNNDTIESIGYLFHKGFRVHGVIDNTPAMDSIIWQAISDGEAFWNVMNEVCKLYNHGTDKTVKSLDKEEV